MAANYSNVQLETQTSFIDQLFKAIQANDNRTVEGILRRSTKSRQVKLKDVVNAEGPGDVEGSQDKLPAERNFGSLTTEVILGFQESTSSGGYEDAYHALNVFQRPLHLACLLGYRDIVKTLLVVSHANIDSRNSSNETPLGIACRAGKLDVVELLLKNGAQAHQEDEVGNTPLTYLVHRNIDPESQSIYRQVLLNLLRQVTEKDADEEVTQRLHAAAFHGQTLVVDVLLQIKPKFINKQDAYGWTALHHAVSGRELDVVQLLLEKGADCQLRTKQPYMTDPEGLAIRSGYFEIEKAICNDQMGRMKFMSSFHMRQTECVEFISASTRYKWLNDQNDSHDQSYSISTPGTKRSTRNMIFNPKFPRTDKALWVHFPANNFSWIQDLCLNIYGDSANFPRLRQLLINALGPQDPRQPTRAFNYEKVDLDQPTSSSWRPEGLQESWKPASKESDSKEPDNPENSMDPKASPKSVRSVTIMSVPVVDVDYLSPGGFVRRCADTMEPLLPRSLGTANKTVAVQAEIRTSPGDRTGQDQVNRQHTPSQSLEANPQDKKMRRHFHAMEILHRAPQAYLHEPKTLDHHMNSDLKEAQLRSLDRDQVLTRHIATPVASTITGKLPLAIKKVLRAFPRLIEDGAALIQRLQSKDRDCDLEVQQP